MFLRREELRLDDIVKVFSHPQALKQCQRKLSGLHTEKIPTNSTVEKLEDLQFGEAIICSLATAKENILDIIDLSFCPKDNVTDFAILTSQKRRTRETLSPVDALGEKKLHNHKTIFLIESHADHIMPDIYKTLGRYGVDTYFMETLYDDKGGTLIPIVAKSLGKKRGEFIRDIRRIGCKITVL